MTRIDPSEAAFVRNSYADPNGRVFRWQGGLYRAIRNAQAAQRYRQLLESGAAARLEAAGLVQTEIADLSLDGYDLVLKHREAPFVSFGIEWCADMLKEAALVTCNVNIELAAHGLTTQDAHSENILFDGPRAVFIDFGSIVPLVSNAPWAPTDQFCRFFLYPLQLMASGHERLARALLIYDRANAVRQEDVLAVGLRPVFAAPVPGVKQKAGNVARKIIPQALHPAARKTLRALRAQRAGDEAAALPMPAMVQRLRREVEAISVAHPKTAWSDYYDGKFPAFTPSDDWTPKHRSVWEVLTRTQPRTVLDIGSNRGWYAQLAARLHSQVVTLETDESCAAQLYLDARKASLPMLSLVMDFGNPSPGYGICNNSRPPATERVRCDMVLALALIHHLVFKQAMEFEQVVEGLSVFSRRWLLLEFIPKEDRYVKDWWSEKRAWYTQEHLIACLRKSFKDVQVFPSHPEPRELLLCTK